MSDEPPGFDPCYRPPDPVLGGKSLAIIGAGIAGLTTARKFQQNGWTVTLFDMGITAGQGGSGNTVGYLSPNTGRVVTDKLQLQTDAWRYAVEYWRDYGQLHPAPILLVATDARKLERFQNFAKSGLTECRLLDPAACKRLFNTQDTVLGGLLIEDSGYVQPSDICAAMSNCLSINNNTVITSVNPKTRLLTDDADQQYGPYDVIIMATANQRPGVVGGMTVPLQYYQGQVAEIRPLGGPEWVLSGLGYICNGRDKACIGATFDPVDDYPGLNVPVDAEITELLRTRTSDLSERQITPEEILQGRASSRTASPDRMPVCGPVADLEWSKQAYNSLCHGRHWQTPPQAQYMPGIYQLCALGARGFSFAPWLANLMFRFVTGGELSQQEKTYAKILHPSRFMIGDFRRMPEKRRWFTEETE